MTDAEVLKLLKDNGMDEVAAKYKENLAQLKAHRMALKSATAKIAYYKRKG